MTPEKNDGPAYNLDLFFEHSLDLLCIVGFDGYFKRVNPIVSKILGYTEEELYSNPVGYFVHPDDKELTAQKRLSLYDNVPLTNFENRYVTKTGETVWLAWTSMPMEKQQVVFAVAKVVNFRKKLEEDRNHEIAELTKTNQDLKQLTYTTSHDLRSPVGNLISLFEMINTSRINDTETLEYINMLRAASADLKKTLDNYIDVLSQSETLKIDTESVDITKSLTKVRGSLRSVLVAAKARITADLSAFNNVNFNKSYLESIFLNLITNSIKYAKEGIAPLITIYTRYSNEQKQLIFEDNGRGFDMDKIGNRIFGFNQTFHNSTDSKGIGLYLVYNHITSLGGKIEVESRPGKGAKFTITFKE